MSVSEKVLWQILKGKRIGFLFRRQYPVGPYVLDFYCPEADLCVEVDGEQHLLSIDNDAKRDSWLLARGIETMRIPSLDLFDHDNPKLTKWVVTIQRACEERSARPAFRRN